MAWQPSSAVPDSGGWKPSTAVPDEAKKADAPHEEVSKSRTALDQGLQGATFGFGDEITDRIGAFIAHQYTGESYDDMLKLAKEQSKERMTQEWEQHPVISGASQIAGSIGTGAAGAGTKVGKAVASDIAGSGTIGRLIKGAGLNAATGALYGAGTADEGHRMEEARKGAEWGVGGGAVGSGIGKIASKVIAPKITGAAKTLMDAGVKLTPGQMSKSFNHLLKTAENSLSSVPFVGSQIKRAQLTSLESFNTAVLNKALAQVGEKMPTHIEQGRGAIEHAGTVIGDKYEKLLPKLTFKLDTALIKDIRDLNNTLISEGIPEKVLKDLNRTVNDVMNSRLDPFLSMDGKKFKDIEQTFNTLRNHHVGDPAKDSQMFADAMYRFQGLLKDTLEKQNPKYGKELSKINSAWAAFARARDASIRRASSGGVFTPNDLLQEIKKSSTKGVFARGDGLLQDLADAGSKILPSNVPDSGTMQRATWAALLGGGAFLHPGAVIPAAVGTAAYTSPAMTAARKLATPGMKRAAVGEAVNKASPVVGGTAGTNISNMIRPQAHGLPKVNLPEGPPVQLGQ